MKFPSPPAPMAAAMASRWRRSGQSVRAYCAGAGLSEPSFYAWRRQLTMRDQAARPQRSAPHFVPVHVVPAAPPSAAPPLDVVLGNGRVIRVAPGFDAALLGAGAVLANIVGTTGASMLLIRPFMRVNAGRLRPFHIVFFIFLVSNVGGCLTPIGDPAFQGEHNREVFSELGLSEAELQKFTQSGALVAHPRARL